MPVTIQELVAGELVSARRAKIAANFEAIKTWIESLEASEADGTTALGNGWVITTTSTTMTISLGGVNKLRLTNDGSLTVTGNITAYGSIA